MLDEDGTYEELIGKKKDKFDYLFIIFTIQLIYLFTYLKSFS